MTGLVEGKRARGRPRISLIGNILCGLHGLAGTDLMSAIRDRRRWTTLVHSCGQRCSIRVTNRREATTALWHDITVLPTLL